MFGKKKLEKPKSVLGIVLYDYDLIINNDLKNILISIKLRKNLNPSRTGKIFDNISLKFEPHIKDISKDKLKLDYRSDKVRDLIIEMMTKIKSLFEKIKNENFDINSPALSNIYSEFEYTFALRETIRKKLKDIEYDYT
ncbi:MAG: hypothetical protein M1479_06720 [Actinobacteria bacterium]|nr:hypothetical protein [Actinomycetota bacterium]